MKKQHIIINNIELKECSSCKNIKTLDKFSRNKPSWDGLKPYCKECASKKGNEYRTKYRDDVLLQKRNWYKKTLNEIEIRNNRDLIKKNKTCTKCKKNLNVFEFRQRANGGFYSICKKCEYNKNKLYDLKNPSLIKSLRVVREQRRRKLAKKLKSDFTNKEWIKCKAYFKNKCAYCNKESKKLTQDHFIPVSKNGEYTKKNIIPSCKSCNSSKHKKDFNEWYEKQSFYSIQNINNINNYFSTL